MASSERIARQVGSTVRRLRLQRRETERHLARMAGIPMAALSAVERGRQLPSAPVLARLRPALDCSEERFSRHFGPFGEVAAIRRRGVL